MTVSILVATIGRPTLERALASITRQARAGDQVMVIGATQEIADRAAAAGCWFAQVRPGNDWGASERAAVMPHVTGDYIAFLDDDDVYLPGARDAMEEAMLAAPGRPTIFKMQIAWTGGTLWDDKVACMGNMGTPMMFLPNNAQTQRGRWGRAYGNDFEFWSSMGWTPDQIHWSDRVIALIRPPAERVA